MDHPLWSKESRVFTDTGSLLEDASVTFMYTRLAPTLRNYGVPPLIIAKSVVGELNRMAVDNNESIARSARTAKELVKGLRDAGVAEVFGGENDDSVADNQLLSVFTTLRPKYRLILISQKPGLVKTILLLNSDVWVKQIQRIEAFRIGNCGDPMRWMLDPKVPSEVMFCRPDLDDGFVSVASRTIPKSRFSDRIGTPSQPIRISERLRTVHVTDSVPATINSHSTSRVSSFKRQEFTTQIDLDKTPVTTPIPGEGEVVKDANGNSLRLIATIGTGGEGTVYETDDDKHVCKIYHCDRLKIYLVDKLKLMTTREIDDPMICWPVSLIYNSHGKSVGYLMPRAQGKELRRSIFIKPLLQKTFPDWTRLHLVKLTYTILKAVEYLHSLNVLLGDVNPGNILVLNESTVFFVDCDSYQIEGFPCPVGMPPYLAPELYGKALHSTLRSMDTECFAIATLVFMLLHPGKPPYSHQGGGDPLENVKKQHFPYPRGDRGAQRPPDGPWRFMFSHLPRYMKDAFHQVFSDGNRLTVPEWRKLLYRYENDLVKGYVSVDPFPKGFKSLNQRQVEQVGGEWRYCGVCGKGFGAFKDEFVTCPECFNSKGSSHNSTRSSAIYPSRPTDTDFPQQRNQIYAPTTQKPDVNEILGGLQRWFSRLL